VSGSRGVVRFVVDQPDKRDYYLAATLFALGEILGGHPKLNALGNPAYPDGYPDPSAGQISTSRQFEILAGYHPDAVAGRGPVRDVRDGRVGPKTAWELGWINSRRLKEISVAAAGK